MGQGLAGVAAGLAAGILSAGVMLATRLAHVLKPGTQDALGRLGFLLIQAMYQGLAQEFPDTACG
jgi:hypothetical protein